MIAWLGVVGLVGAGALRAGRALVSGTRAVLNLAGQRRALFALALLGAFWWHHTGRLCDDALARRRALVTWETPQATVRTQAAERDIHRYCHRLGFG